MKHKHWNISPGTSNTNNNQFNFNNDDEEPINDDDDDSRQCIYSEPIKYSHIFYGIFLLFVQCLRTIIPNKPIILIIFYISSFICFCNAFSIHSFNLSSPTPPQSSPSPNSTTNTANSSTSASVHDNQTSSATQQLFRPKRDGIDNLICAFQLIDHIFDFI